MASKAYIERFRGNAYIECKFAEKETAKQMGAKWDYVKKMWYIPPGKNVQPYFEKWKTYCRLCNSLLICETSKGGKPCENTEAGVCCEYNWSGSGGHCEYDLSGSGGHCQ
jgi:hypothetical protein